MQKPSLKKGSRGTIEPIIGDEEEGRAYFFQIWKFETIMRY